MSKTISYAVQSKLNNMRWRNVTIWDNLRETRIHLKNWLKMEKEVGCVNPFKYRIAKRTIIIEEVVEK